MTMLVQTSGLCKQFGSFMAVADVTLTIGAGEVLALLGPNGAGKTTTIRMLASILRPTNGTASVAGYDVSRRPVEARRSVGLLTEHHALYTRMRAGEYLEFFGRAYGMEPREIRRRSADLLQRFELEDARDRRLGEFSKGMRQKLALVRALLHNPPVLLLDEPTSAMDPGSARVVRDSVLGLRNADRAVLVCTHNLREAELLADRIAIIRGGCIVAQGTAAELRRTFLGDPLMELRVVGSLDGASSLLPPDAVLVESGEGWIRYRVASPAEVNPKVLQSMAAANVPVVTLAPVEQSLEEIYLKVIEDTDPGYE